MIVFRCVQSKLSWHVLVLLTHHWVSIKSGGADEKAQIGQRRDIFASPAWNWLAAGVHA